MVTGDTKVMGRGELDGIVINTTGVALTERLTADSGLRPGDRIMVTGTMGDHGLAIMAARRPVELEVISAPTWLRSTGSFGCSPGGRRGRGGDEGPDPGGLSSALHEMAEKSGVGDPDRRAGGSTLG